MGMSIRVVLAEDDYLVREGVRRVLESAPDVDVIAECGDGEALLTAVAADPPDVVVTDVRMPPSGRDEGIRAANLLRVSHPAVGVVVLSQYADPEYAVALLAEGSDRRAYLLKKRVHERRQLVLAVREVAGGGSAVDPKVVEALVRRGSGAHSPLRDLTAREQEVLAELARGASNAAIADSLFLTKSAIEKHINAIFSKLGLAGAQDVSQRVKATLMFLDGAHD
jgi:DNA-binding NarL/FixJ family response regulator